MHKHKVAITQYRKKIKSVEKVIELSEAFKNLSGNEKVFLKPNVVFWSIDPLYPKYGVITTSRVVEDVIIALKKIGIKDISIGEGIVTIKPNDYETMRHAFETLGYNRFNKRYGVKVINIFERPFEKVDLGDGIELNFSSDFLNSDFIISLPVLKTHSQMKVSLGIKNLKGLIDINSRKKCHSPDTTIDLETYVSRLPNNLPPAASIIDGIFTNERGPATDGRMRRSNILIASSDLFAADKVGSKVLGYEPSDVPYFVKYAKDHDRPIDFSDVEVVGKSIEKVQVPLEYKFPYSNDGFHPIAFQKQGIKGLAYREYDNSLCTYCSFITSATMNAIALAWKGDPWDDVEVLVGKRMDPTPGKKKTILLGQCMVNKHRNNSDINEMIPIKGCPAKAENIVKGLHQAGIDVNPEIFENMHKIANLNGIAYRHRFNEFDESFFIEGVNPNTVPPIDNVSVSQLYLDNGESQKEQAKFEVRFFGIVGEKNTNAIKSLVIEGPNGYEFQIKNQRFNFQNGNGYIVDKLNRGMIKYIAHDKNGYLEDGKYDFTIEYFTDEIRTKTRELNTNNRLIKEYVSVKNKITYSHERKPKYKEDSRIFAGTKWTPLSKLGGSDAFYANLVSEGNTDKVNYHDLTFFDDIFTMSMLISSYGLNKDSMLANTRWKPLKQGAEYSWTTEICDANTFENLNVRIMQPTQHFKLE